MPEVKNTASRRLAEVGAKRDARWWLPEYKDERARRMMFVARELWQDLQNIRGEYVQYERLYGNAPILGLGPSNYRRRGVFANWSRLSFNGIKSVIDTWVSLVTNDRPKCTALTDGGDWALQQKAKLLETFHDGIDHELNYHQTWTESEFDTAIYGVGWQFYYIDKYDPDHWRPAVERVPPNEMLFDERFAMYGWDSVRTILRIKWVDKLSVVDEFPERALEIVNASAVDFEDPSATGAIDGLARYQDLVPRISGWVLPTHKGAGDGLYAQCVGDVLLEEMPYLEDRLPFEPTYRKRPRFGLVGSSACDELRGPQKELNTLVQKQQRSHHLLGAGHWLIEEGSNVNTNHMDNQIGSMVRYRGTPPQFIAVEPLPESVYRQSDKIWLLMHQMMGISLQTAQGEVPANIHSAKGQLVYAASQDKRFQTDYREAQDAYLRAHRQFETLARQISEHQKNFMVRACTIGPNLTEAVRWHEASAPENEVLLHIYPTNALANDPVGRLEQVQQLANAGWIDPRQAMRLLNFPDLQSALDDIGSSYTATMARIDLIMRKGEYHPPEPTMDLAEAVKLAQSAYNRYSIMRGCPPDRLGLLLRWIAQAMGLPEMGTTPQAQPAPGAPKLPNPLAAPGPAMSPGIPPGAGPPPAPPGAPPQAAAA